MKRLALIFAALVLLAGCGDQSADTGGTPATSTKDNPQLRRVFQWGVAACRTSGPHGISRDLGGPSGREAAARTYAKTVESGRHADAAEAGCLRGFAVFEKARSSKTAAEPEPARKPEPAPGPRSSDTAQPSVPDLYKNTFDTAAMLCEDAGPSGIAREFGGSPNDWDDLASRYAQGSTGEHVEYAKLGCLQGFAQR